jgi:hypothetical protein
VSAVELRNNTAEVSRDERRAAARARGIAEREALSARLTSEGAFDLVQKLAGCGEPFRLVCTCCGSKRSVEVQCRRRWCPSCAFAVQMDRLSRYRRAAEEMQWPLFITLTVPNSADPECIREVREKWGRMRRRKLMVDRIKGGISTIEVTNTGAGWHPHLHVLADCKWLALHTPAPTSLDSEGVRRQKYDHARLELSALWGQVISNPVAVVSALRKPAGECLRYALKYAIKGSDLIESKENIAPLIRVLSKSRMVSTFGSCHGRVEADDEDERPAVTCGDCGSIQAFVPQSVVDRLYRSSYDKSHKIS